ncbi:cytochrome c oxidase assembly protein [Miltoncostaea marina]|uniref:cytochrome c oxidase assembly protein n=1 Tax=Miltoncostaea marina TaxID=2843215 RepID=UPI001C3E5BC8|nr:cytochrome c oxidase assembly protein [Miltoncostaea marina]
MIGALHAGGATAHHDLAGAWSLDPLVLAAAAAGVVLYAVGWRRLRRRGRPDLADGRRAALFAAGVAVLLLSVLSPLDPVGEEYLLSGHMLQHVLLGDVAPLLIVLGIAGPLALFAVPRPLLRGVGRSPRLRAVARFLTRPLAAVVLWVAVTALWHVPVAFEYALAHRWAHDLEHATMFVAGFAVWLHIAAAIPRARLSGARRSAMAAGLLAVGMVVSTTIFLSDPLYDVYVAQEERLFGLTPTGDQVRAAMLMTTEQTLTLGVAAMLLLWNHVERVAARSREELAAEAAAERAGAD